MVLEFAPVAPKEPADGDIAIYLEPDGFIAALGEIQIDKPVSLRAVIHGVDDEHRNIKVRVLRSRNTPSR